MSKIQEPLGLPLLLEVEYHPGLVDPAPDPLSYGIGLELYVQSNQINSAGLTRLVLESADGFPHG